MSGAHEPIAGRFVWYDLMATDPAAALAFYGGLFGWTSRPVLAGAPGRQIVFRSGDRDVAGVVPLASADDGAASRWVSYAGVGELETALARVAPAGGQVSGPAADFPSFGRFAPIADPLGAGLSLLEGAGPSPTRDDAAGPGHFCWNELLTADPKVAAAFYRDVLGWTTTERDLGAFGRYWIFWRGDRDVAGMVASPAGVASRSLWLPYVQVASAEDTAALAVELGGAVVMPPADLPGRGRSAMISDPAGGMVAVFELIVAA